MAIRISREIYEFVEQEAKEKGITPIDLITQIIEETLGRESKPVKKSPASKRTAPNVCAANPVRREPSKND